MPINCPKCGEPLILTPARTEYKGAAAPRKPPTSLDLKRALAPYTEHITINHGLGVVIVRMKRRVETSLWVEINKIMESHAGDKCWIGPSTVAGTKPSESRWEVPA